MFNTLMKLEIWYFLKVLLTFYLIIIDWFILVLPPTLSANDSGGAFR